MSGTHSRWTRRLAHHATFGPEEHRALDDAIAVTRHLATRDDLTKAGDPADRIFVVLAGLGCRYKLLPDGRRQILAYLLPGDMCDPRQMLLSRMDHSLCVLTPSEVATLTFDTVRRLQQYPGIERAMARNALVQEAITREWLVNVGHRTAFERLGHLFCELFMRLQMVGLTREHSCELPLTQSELADTLALSSVHVNRTLMEMRRLGLVTLQNRQLIIHDFPALCTAAAFDPLYLHLPHQS